MQIKKGVPASPGIAIAKAIILDSQEYRIPRRNVDPTLCQSEIDRLTKAFADAIDDLADLEKEHGRLEGVEMRDLLSVHRHFLQDRSLQDRIAGLIEKEKVTAEYAVATILRQVYQHFAQIQDRYMSERAGDILDIEKRLLRHLIDLKEGSLLGLDHEVIVVAKDLRPTQIASFDRRYVKGIACDTGGKTGHASIIARAKGIPAVTALSDMTQTVRRGDTLIVDGRAGIVIVDPDEITVNSFREQIRRIRTLRKNLEPIKHKPAVTRDNAHVSVLANIEFPEEVEQAIEAGAEGIGLFRTEFMYLQSREEPSEETQFRVYADIVKTLGGRPATIRTMDLGADKYTQSHRFTPETNPFLGLRSIRFSLKHKDMFTTQLRAILRASAGGAVKIMFPLITNLKEFRLAREVLALAMSDIDSRGIPYDKDIPVGIMVEVPSAALMARNLAREASFFSIGTNDLTQYTLAVDRGNALVSDLFSAVEPAVLNLIRTTVEGARAEGIEVSVCGEMAAEPRYVMLLLGLGIRALSLVPTMIPQIKKIISAVSIADCEQVAQQVMTMESVEEIVQFLTEQTRPLMPEVFGK